MENKTEILPGIEILGKALWLSETKTLIIADLHIGYEEYLNEQGILVPRFQFSETKRELEELFKEKKIKPKTIVINGDLKHEFGEISAQEWKESLSIIDFLSEKCKNIILIKGNHDTILGPIAEKRNLKVKNFYLIKNKICILHGHKIFLDKAVHNAEILIIAHEHPAISLREGAKQEIYKCFLLGEWKKKKIIVMPSFLPITEGSDVSKEKLLSPFLHDISDFEIFIIGDKIYRFGKIKDLQKSKIA